MYLRYCKKEVESQSIIATLEACQEVVCQPIKDDTDHLYNWAIGVSAAETAASARLPHCKFADPGAQAISIWMRAIYESVKEFRET